MGKVVKTIVGIAVAVFAPYAAAALGLTGFAATAFGFGLQLATNAVLGSFGGSNSATRGGGAGVADSGFLVNQQGNTRPIDIVYGKRYIAGTRVYIDTTDDTGNPSGDEYLHQVFAVCQGGVYSDGRDAIVGITKILLNDRVLWDSTNGYNDYFKDDEGNELVAIRTYNGSAGQVYTAPDNQTGANFAMSDHFNTGGHDGKGVVWAYLIMKYDRDIFPGSPTVIFEVDGKKIQNNAGTYTSDSAVRQNPANVLYDYLTNNRYGKGLDPATLDTQSFIDASAYCTSAGLTFNGAVQTSQTIFFNTQEMLAAANCNLVFSNGKYKLQPVKVEDFTNAFVFDESNITGDWTISLGSKKTRFNTFTVNYFNPDLEWASDSIVVDNATYISEDNGAINQKQIDLPYTSNKALATKLANYYLDTSRHQTAVKFTAVHSALQVEVGAPVYVTHSTPGWTNKKFRVASLVLTPDSLVEVTLVEYAPDSVYLENN